MLSYEIVSTGWGHHRILIVDDNATNRTLIVSLLKSRGCRYETANDGLTALALLREAIEQADPFHIALLDQQMPGMDGMELGRRIKNDPELAATIIVMVTSVGKRGDAAILEQIGFAGYLSKPVRQLQLYDCLTIVMERAATKTDKTKSGIVTRHTVAESSPRNARILIAEDDIINQKVAQKMLTNLGYQTDVAANGIEVIRALEIIKYDLVLMDCQMPEMDGYEATAMIRSAHSNVINHAVPIVAMTANAIQGDQEECIAAGMNDYLAKPVTKLKLAEVLEKWLERPQRSQILA